jgi:hypothetical protein
MIKFKVLVPDDNAMLTYEGSGAKAPRVNISSIWS